MIEYSVTNFRDFKNSEALLTLASQFTDVPINFKTLLRYYSIHGARIVLAYDKGILIGFYLYTFGDVYFRELHLLQYLINVLAVNNIDKKDVTVPLFSLVDKSYPVEVYYEMNKLRVADAKGLGYKYGIVNINEDYRENNDFCRMKEWSIRASFFENLTNTTIVNTEYLNEHGDPILIQYY